MQRYLVLEDGSIYAGEGFGSDELRAGEVVFTTGMTGYQEAVSDQSYAGQILVFTNPLIGNYGVNLDDCESIEPACSGVVCHELARVSSNWRQQGTFADFLKQMNIPGISGIDTRAITKKLRSKGTMRGKLTATKDQAQAAIADLQSPQPIKLNQQVATSRPYPNPGSKRNVVVVDFGLKHSILRELAQRDCNTIVMPYTATAKQILQLHPDGVLLSNGPGDPKSMPESVLTMIRQLQEKLPLFGICLGHQLFALANGADTFKMKFGHRGFNHPVREIATGRIFFTSQNHGYAVDPASIDNRILNVTHQEINDQTVEGLHHKQHPAFSVQFHPDAAPGPHDAVTIFDDFMQMIDLRKEERHAEKN
ncbi:MAG: carbamoyl phosphate synthase small subunit [Liquorilactobacillus ghanensis]|jgi:carbamoyl-phosphate synthase small subunit|uniref:Carbamoyl phosphate synthase small chain n=1 Tax=Liquorilactobacillus ghanensis DSM 18630 TaxID=1423750 RepID=A0A0R1VR34_9LACO|nr:carbamoyl phosphate synthase small subunit [Liquorilactobacillus ghanensis]KRM07941.1 carbamoyl phosphate synthase small subunit [Liquorilactobacillus ghanensis DSM 18630]